MKPLPLSRMPSVVRLGVSLSFVGFLVSGFLVFANEIVDVDEDGLPDAWELENSAQSSRRLALTMLTRMVLMGLLSIALVQSLLSRIPMEIRFSTAWTRHL